MVALWGTWLNYGGLEPSTRPIDNRPHSRKSAPQQAQGDTATIISTEGVRDRARCVPIRVASSPVFILPSVRPGAHPKQVNNLPHKGDPIRALNGPGLGRVTNPPQVDNLRHKVEAAF